MVVVLVDDVMVLFPCDKMTTVMTVPRSQKYRAGWAVIGVSLVVALLLWVHFSRPNTGIYGPIIQEIAAGKFQGDGRGHVDLSGPFPGVTPHDEMFLVRRSDDSFLAMFPTYYGRGTSLVALLYTSHPLQDEDTFSRPEMPTRRLIDVGSWTGLSIDKRVDDHWYQVSHHLH
jgi:hypothetical protein